MTMDNDIDTSVNVRTDVRDSSINDFCRCNLFDQCDCNAFLDDRTLSKTGKTNHSPRK